MAKLLQLYFAGSIRAGRQDAQLYYSLVELLKSHGKIFTEHVADPNLSEAGDAHLDDKFIHDRDLDWLQQSDALIAEVTQPSLGVGYEIGRAVAMNKPVLCLFRPSSGKSLSAMIRGAQDGKSLVVQDYETLDEASTSFKTFLDPLKK
ncbi:5-hydroxymethyl-dUMP N-hydrolase-like [Oscarella lobularis]|uniref:5-hydroxymethyl-dUMP N-hydrolase-like n=1 Tax=Oscarella lobularis TaxID=121494 RepID=UPI003313F7EF